MQMNTDTARLSPEERERIVRGFEACLDRYVDGAPGEDEPPPGLSPELLSALQNGDPLPPLEGAQPGNGADLYSLWAATTALAQEVRLQGRTFKQLQETLAGNARSLETSALVPQAEARQARRQEIDVLLDLRDRMERGSKSARSALPELAPSRLPWLARWLGLGTDYARHAQEILTAISDGYDLTLSSLDEALVACGVSRIACQGQSFDPKRMAAVAVEAIGSVPEGTVVEIYRNGYEWNGQVYRTAQVKVARPANNK